MTQARERYIVTGGAGFIGSHFVDLAIQEGKEVLVLDALTYAGKKENLNEALASKHAELIVGDIRDSQLVKTLFNEFKPDAIFHFAAESHVDRSIEGPRLFIDTNIVGTSVLLESALGYWQQLEKEKASQFRYIQISTDEVFGALTNEGHFTEESPFAPNSPYSASKASADLLVRAWHRTFGLPAITTHCSNNYGPRQFPEKLIPHMIFCALQGKPLPVYGKGTNVRDWIHVLDHSRGVLLAALKGKPGERYCFGGGEEWKNIDLVKKICSTLDRLSPRIDGKPHESGIQFVTDRLGHDWRYAIDDRKAKEELGYKPKHTFEQGLSETIQYYLKMGEPNT